MTFTWPEAGNTAEIVLADGRGYLSQVVDVAGPVFTVALPAAADGKAVIGDPLSLRWAGKRGLYSASGHMVGLAGGDHTRWLVECTEPPEVISRRSAVRSPADVPVRLVARRGGEWEGRARDLSESGLRCLVYDVQAPPDRLEVVVELDVQGSLITVPGAVLRSEPGSKSDTVDVVVVLEPDEDTATAIRRFVFESQVRARKVGGR